MHAVRPHRGQGAVARRLMGLLTPASEMYQSHSYAGKVQDAYSLRCAPQVHGIAHDTIAFAESVLEVELNRCVSAVRAGRGGAGGSGNGRGQQWRIWAAPAR